MKVFEKFNDMVKYCKEETGCNIYPGVGICHRFDLKTCILRSVDDTSYYPDNLEEEEHCMEKVETSHSSRLFTFTA